MQIFPVKILMIKMADPTRPPPSDGARDAPEAEERSMKSLHAAFLAHPPGTKLPETRVLIRGQVRPYERNRDPSRTTTPAGGLSL